VKGARYEGEWKDDQ
jgi:hypothetical protein